ncbi:MAG: hypothetical protein ACN6NV_12485 [Acinetobacter gandensis]|uniref:hypothetical protein n=1 Tax=Acinetobacter TaxID=469 RepID=UPI0015D42DA3|nr:hypothetical protein [Acinetobacter sp. YH1901134]
MRIFLIVLQYACVAFALFLGYQVSTALISGQYDLMEVVADVGTILICIDLAVFLFTSNAKQGISIEDYAKQLEQPPSKLVYVTRKMGHFGILLIITSWIVPMIR